MPSAWAEPIKIVDQNKNTTLEANTASELVTKSNQQKSILSSAPGAQVSNLSNGNSIAKTVSYIASSFDIIDIVSLIQETNYKVTTGCIIDSTTRCRSWHSSTYFISWSRLIIWNNQIQSLGSWWFSVYKSYVGCKLTICSWFNRLGKVLKEVNTL